MNAKLLGRFEPGSQEWHDARRLRIGGSEIAAVLGLSAWQSPFSLWHLKAGQISPEPDNPYTDWGRRLEPVVAQKFLDDHPDLTPEPDQGQAYAHADRPWQTASHDVLFSDSFLEVKTARRDDAWYDGIPVYYRCQVLWTMDVLGVDHAWLAVLIGGSDYREYPMVMDDDARTDLAVMREAGQKFIDSLIDGTPPDIDDSYATFQTVRRMHPDIELDSEHEVSREVAEAYLDANQALAEIERQQRRARTDIARHMGRAQYATCEGVRIARRQPARGDGPPVLVSTRRRLPREAMAS